MIKILYQDEHSVVVDKPAGMLMHRSFLDVHETQFLMQTVRDQLGRKVYPVHRLDRKTSGAVLFALSPEAAHAFGQQFQAGKVYKSYQAIVRGATLPTGSIDYPLTPILDEIADVHAQNPTPQSALSDYHTLARAELPFSVQAKFKSSRFSWLKLQPHTGRKHQLRRHLKHIFHPIIGDTTYGDLKQNRAMADCLGVARMWLHADELHFQDLNTGQVIKVQSALGQEWQTMQAAFTRYPLLT